MLGRHERKWCPPEEETGGWFQKRGFGSGGPSRQEDRVTESAMPPVCGGGHRGGPPAAQSAHRSPLKDWRPSVTDDTAATEGNAQVPSRCRLGEERVQPASRAPPRRGLARPPIGPSGGHEAMPRARHDARGRDVPPRARPCASPHVWCRVTPPPAQDCPTTWLAPVVRGHSQSRPCW